MSHPGCLRKGCPDCCNPRPALRMMRCVACCAVLTICDLLYPMLVGVKMVCSVGALAGLCSCCSQDGRACCIQGWPSEGCVLLHPRLALRRTLRCASVSSQAACSQVDVFLWHSLAAHREVLNMPGLVLRNLFCCMPNLSHDVFSVALRSYSAKEVFCCMTGLLFEPLCCI